MFLLHLAMDWSGTVGHDQKLVPDYCYSDFDFDFLHLNLGKCMYIHILSKMKQNIFLRGIILWIGMEGIQNLKWT